MSDIFDEIAQIIQDRDASWRAEANCAGEDVSTFFTLANEGISIGRGGWATHPRFARARELCAACPVAEQCGDYAYRNHLQGWFAGTWRYPAHSSKGVDQLEAERLRRHAARKEAS